MKTVRPVMKTFSGEENKQWAQYVVVLSAGILAVGSGLHFAWPSPSIPKLRKHDLGFEINTEEISYIISIAPFGYLIGSPGSSFLLDIIGRKNVLILIAIPQTLAWLLIANSNSVWTLYCARLIVGVGESALYTALPAYLCEISQPNIRGILGTALTLGMMLGIILINCYGSYLPIRTTAYISLAAPLLFIATFVFMPESPYFLLMKGRLEDARRSLKQLRQTKNVEDELTQLNEDVHRQISEPGTIKDIFTIKSNMKAFYILIGLRTLQQFSGVSSFITYAQVIFEEAGGGITPAQSSIIYCTTQLVFGIIGAILIDKYGRRPLVIGSTIGTTIFLFVEGAYFHFKYDDNDVISFSWVAIVGMLVNTIVFSCGLAGAPNLMMGELLSASIKAKALGLTNIWFAVCLIFTYKLFHYFNENYGMHAPFYFYCACCAIGIIFTYFYLPETKGKSLEEIQLILKCSKKEKQEANKSTEIFTITKL